MADIDYERLADLIFERLMKRQEEYERDAEQNEHQIAELARLETLMTLYQEQEKYEQAAIILRKYNNLRTRLIKKGIINE
jgi:hypothetical protein